MDSTPTLQTERAWMRAASALGLVAVVFHWIGGHAYLGTWVASVVGVLQLALFAVTFYVLSTAITTANAQKARVQEAMHAAKLDAQVQSLAEAEAAAARTRVAEAEAAKAAAATAVAAAVAATATVGAQASAAHAKLATADARVAFAARAAARAAAAAERAALGAGAAVQEAQGHATAAVAEQAARVAAEAAVLAETFAATAAKTARSQQSRLIGWSMPAEPTRTLSTSSVSSDDESVSLPSDLLDDDCDWLMAAAAAASSAAASVIGAQPKKKTYTPQTLRFLMPKADGAALPTQTPAQSAWGAASTQEQPAASEDAPYVCPWARQKSAGEVRPQSPLKPAAPTRSSGQRELQLKVEHDALLLLHLLRDVAADGKVVRQSLIGNQFKERYPGRFQRGLIKILVLHLLERQLITRTGPGGGNVFIELASNTGSLLEQTSWLPTASSVPMSEGGNATTAAQLVGAAVSAAVCSRSDTELPWWIRSPNGQSFVAPPPGQAMGGRVVAIQNTFGFIAVDGMAQRDDLFFHTSSLKPGEWPSAGERVSFHMKLNAQTGLMNAVFVRRVDPPAPVVPAAPVQQQGYGAVGYGNPNAYSKFHKPQVNYGNMGYSGNAYSNAFSNSHSPHNSQPVHAHYRGGGFNRPSLLRPVEDGPEQMGSWRRPICA